MCHQSVGLIQRAIEYAGITTVSISLLREITERIQPPRALFAPFPLGYPLGEPNNPELQKRIMRAAFALLFRMDFPVFGGLLGTKLFHNIQQNAPALLQLLKVSPLDHRMRPFTTRAENHGWYSCRRK